MTGQYRVSSGSRHLTTPHCQSRSHLYDGSSSTAKTGTTITTRLSVARSKGAVRWSGGPLALAGCHHGHGFRLDTVGQPTSGPPLAVAAVARDPCRGRPVGAYRCTSVRAHWHCLSVPCSLSGGSSSTDRRQPLPRTAAGVRIIGPRLQVAGTADSGARRWRRLGLGLRVAVSGAVNGSKAQCHQPA